MAAIRLRALYAVVLVAVAIWFCHAVLAVRAYAPTGVDCRDSAFLAPAPGAVVAGAVEIRGRANVPDFRFYKVEFSPANRDAWHLIGPDVIRRPVREGILVVWQTTGVPNGTYSLRMHVVDPTGNYCEKFLQPVVVANALNPTATPTATETIAVSILPPAATPTLRPSVITDILPSQAPSLPSARGMPLPESNLLVFGFCFLMGACGMLSVVGLIGLLSRLGGRSL